jgi:hypothetical protein
VLGGERERELWGCEVKEVTTMFKTVEIFGRALEWVRTIKSEHIPRPCTKIQIVESVARNKYREREMEIKMVFLHYNASIQE